MNIVGASPPVSVTVPPTVAESASMFVAAMLLTAGGAGGVVKEKLGDATESPAVLVAKAVKK
jgi:hypothetical protein